MMNLGTENSDQKSQRTEYTDDLIEERILHYLKTHNGDDSHILEEFPKTAAFHYFSVTRANILRWYPFTNRDRVLEVGAGLGALTTYLAETCGHVVALEPSAVRSEIVRIRCNDYQNTEVLDVGLQEYTVPGKFDYVILVGVLEYAFALAQGDNPWVSLLKSAGERLAPGGKLLLAIENKYGLKYWCGASEDHTGIPFDSINDYSISGKHHYEEIQQLNGVRTFGRVELEKLLTHAGFEHYQFFYPFPDYKYPSAILSDRTENAAEIVAQTKFHYTDEAALVADERSVWPEIIENGCLGFFTNSFFVEAAREDVGLCRIHTAVMKRDYKREFSLTTTLDGLSVRRKAACREASSHLRSLEENTRFLQERGVACVNQVQAENGESIAENIHASRADRVLADALNAGNTELATMVLKQLRSNLLRSSDSYTQNGKLVLETGFLDLNLQNAFWVDGSLMFFDQEWREANVPLNYIAYRSIVYSCGHLKNIEMMSFAYRFFGISEEDVVLYKKKETAFLKSLMDDTACSFFDGQMYQERLTMEGKINRMLASKEAHIEQLLQSERELEQTIRNKEGHIELLLESDRELDRIHNSRSWKILSVWWGFRDSLLPQNSRRRLLLKLGFKFARHPVRFMQKLDMGHIKTFREGLRSGSIASTSERLDNYLGRDGVKAEKPKLLPNKKYEKAKDYPPIRVPSSYTPLVSIIIPVFNEFAYTYNCVQSIVNHTGKVPYEVIIADDCSDDLTKSLGEIIEGVRIVRNETNLRFLKNCNRAADFAKGKYILFLNNDTQVQKDWLSSLVELIESADDIGMVGSKLIYPDGRLQEAGGIVWKDASVWNYGHGQDPGMPEYNYVKETDYISGASIMIRAKLWREIGGFDERFAPAYYEDTDLAFSVRQRGCRVLYQPLSVVVHFEGVSNGTDTSAGLKAYQVENQKKFREKWQEVLQREHDPNGCNVFKARDRSQKKKHILVVDHYVPHFDKDAGGRCTFMYLKLFVKMGFQVTFIGDNFFRHEPYTTVLNQLGIEVLYGDSYFLGWKKWLKENASQFDYVYLQRPHISIKYIDLVKENTLAKIVYFAHDLHHIRERREYEITHDPKLLESSEKWKKIEYELFTKADVGHVVGSYEQELMQKAFPGKPIRNLPLYLYEELPADIEKDFSKRKDILFVGGFQHHPNLDAVLWFAREIFPQVEKAYPDIKWHIVGGDQPPEVLALESEHILIHGFVSDEELEALYRSCKMAVVPLRYGAGVKGKVVEAQYYQCPLVTTPIGAEGLSMEENSMLVEEDADRMAQRLIELYGNNEELKVYSDREELFIRRNFMIENAIKVIRMDFVN